MKIYLNDRLIRFLPEFPNQMLPTDLVIVFKSIDEMLHGWQDFQRYEKYRNFLIVDRSAKKTFFTEGLALEIGELAGKSNAFKAFSTIFKYVPAAGGLVRNEAGEYLFIHRLGFWDLPKGKLSKKDFQGGSLQEALPRAALREVMEETGLEEVSITEKLPCTWHIYTAKSKLILKQTFWFGMTANSDQKLKPQTSEGIFLVKWTTSENLHCVLSHTYGSIRDFLVPLLF